MEVFLSASIPLPSRDRVYYETVDLLALREALKALAEHVLPVGRITYGGHPAITPLLALFAKQADLDRSKFTLFQSAMFDGKRKEAMPADNVLFADVRIVPAPSENDKENLKAMRVAMLSSQNFDAAVFIGGMDGCLEELELFKELQPGAQILPIATTGAAARSIFENGDYNPSLGRSRTYPTIFRRLLSAT
ncbi:SLOG domain-containing protein [Novosphingobium clariflavum]|uniref:Uncharacterized protein n=1 Tax=Novosphingobium clariflavum TaxID=2029884 RepID=A0ABV6S459_9SPHN|nr:hypothetical protein [Novosphingobium clariflavum]